MEDIKNIKFEDVDIDENLENLYGYEKLLSRDTKLVAKIIL
ncbi:hypothetical protein [Anaerococcus tetradius]|nr:hypothetical protein [Anaerococcus tetradius]